MPSVCMKNTCKQNAYDLVAWEFLFCAMEVMNFPELFIQWIKHYVSTPKFSILINGVLHGYFEGAKGLRHGDPISSFLFLNCNGPYIVPPQYICIYTQITIRFGKN